MKVKILLATLGALMAVGSIIVLIPGSASSAGVMDEMGAHLKTAAETGAGYGEPMDPRTSASLIIRSLLGVIGTVMVILMIYAGFLWMTAAGNEDKVTKAKKIITSAAIGLIIILMAYSITWFLTFTALGGRSTQVPQVPTDEYAPMSQ